MNRWISVEEELPENGVQVLVFSNNGEIFTSRRAVIVSHNSRNSRKEQCGAILECMHFTHWMPLPKSPKDSNE